MRLQVGPRDKWINVGYDFKSLYKRCHLRKYKCSLEIVRDLNKILQLFSKRTDEPRSVFIKSKRTKRGSMETVTRKIVCDHVNGDIEVQSGKDGTKDDNQERSEEETEYVCDEMRETFEDADDEGMEEDGANNEGEEEEVREEKDASGSNSPLEKTTSEKNEDKTKRKRRKRPKGKHLNDTENFKSETTIEKEFNLKLRLNLEVIKYNCEKEKINLFDENFALLSRSPNETDFGLHMSELVKIRDRLETSVENMERIKNEIKYMFYKFTEARRASHSIMDLELESQISDSWTNQNVLYEQQVTNDTFHIVPPHSLRNLSTNNSFSHISLDPSLLIGNSSFENVYRRVNFEKHNFTYQADEVDQVTTDFTSVNNFVGITPSFDGETLWETNDKPAFHTPSDPLCFMYRIFEKVHLKHMTEEATVEN